MAFRIHSDFINPSGCALEIYICLQVFLNAVYPMASASNRILVMNSHEIGKTEFH